MTKKLPGKTNQRSWAAIGIIILGGIFLLNSLDIMHLGHFIGDWWPLILVIVGFVKLQNDDRRNGAVLFVIGLVLLSATLDFINWGIIFRFWPLIILYIGISMLMRSKGHQGWSLSKVSASDEDNINASAIFGSVEKVVNSKSFTGGNVMALFGGVDLDLRKAQALDAGCVLNVTALFGGVEIMVPETWNVIISGTPIFGGIEDHTGPVAENSVNVTIQATVAFGGLEIKV